MSDPPEYDWYGDWQGPGHGKYVIRYNDEELEPGDIIDVLRNYEDLLEQIKRVGELHELKTDQT